MNRSTTLLLAALLAPTLPAGAGDFGTRADVVRLVGHAAEGLRSDRDTALAAITARAPGYIDRDLYLFVHDMHGTVEAHGLLPDLIGRNVIELRDVDGVAFVRERVALAREAPAFWHHHRFADAVTGKVLPKDAYCERVRDSIVCSGVYRRP